MVYFVNLLLISVGIKFVLLPELQPLLRHIIQSAFSVIPSDV